jgi:hypothetical protein
VALACLAVGAVVTAAALFDGGSSPSPDRPAAPALAPAEAAAAVAPPPVPGYVVVGADGSASPVGPLDPGLAAPGDLAGTVGVATTPGGTGAWRASAAGAVRATGAAVHAGDATSSPPTAPIVAIAATPTGRGYWLAGADGGVFAYGDAAFAGSLGPTRPARPVVGIAVRPGGAGYWLAAADGGVFAFGDAPFRGAASGRPLAAPIVGVAATPSGGGYWLVAADGGVFAFGDAVFAGSLGKAPPAAPIVGVAATPTGDGYWLVGADGGVFAFGDAPFHGAVLDVGPPGPRPPGRTVVGLAPAPGQPPTAAELPVLPPGATLAPGLDPFAAAAANRALAAEVPVSPAAALVDVQDEWVLDRRGDRAVATGLSTTWTSTVAGGTRCGVAAGIEGSLEALGWRRRTIETPGPGGTGTVRETELVREPARIVLTTSSPGGRYSLRVQAAAGRGQAAAGPSDGALRCVDAPPARAATG